MQQLPVLTKQQQKTLLDFHKSSKPGETQYLNPADPKHKKFITTMLSAAGRTEEKYPHLHRAIASAKGFPKTPKGKNAKEKVHLVDAGKTADGKTTVTVWARSSANNVTKGGNLMVFDGDNDKLLAQGENIAVRNGFVACPTRSLTAKPAGKKLSVIYMGHNTEEDGKTRFFSFATNAEVADQGIQVNVTDPRIKISGNTQIHIAVGRTGGAPANCDYVYIEPKNEPEPNAYLIAPFVGNVGLSGSINLPALTIADFSTSIFVNNGSGNTQEVARSTQHTPDSKVISSFSVGGAPNILQWNFPYDQLGYEKTNSIVYNMTSLGNEVDSFFYFAFNGIPFKDGSVSPPFYVCSDDTPEKHSINCTKIRNLYYWWHCLAKGTLVTLEDGSKVPIEKINETYRVQTGGKEQSLAVWATVLGHHSSDPKKGERDEIFQLTTANGKKITAIENHMVFMTADKCRAISHLVPGDPVMTDDGASTVKTLKAVAADQMFYGLALGNQKEKAKKNFPHNLAGYYANGILCGDQQAMRHHVREAHQDLEYMLPLLKPELHQDYTSALGDQRFKPEPESEPEPTASPMAMSLAAEDFSMLSTTTAGAASGGVIQAMFYASPYSTLPPGVTVAGITVQTVAAQSPTPSTVQNPVLVIRLRQASSGMVIGISNTSGPGTSVKTANFQPSFPLSAAEPYMVDVIWVSSGTPPENIDWSSAVTSAPVSAANVNVESASYDGTNVTATLSYGAAGIGTGAQVNVFSLSGSVLVYVGSAQTPNTSVVVPVNATGFPPAFFISAQTAIPATNAGGSGSFSAPYSLGPQSLIVNTGGTAVFGGVPQAATAVTAAVYDGTSVSLTWSLGTQVGCVNPTGSIVQVLSGSKVVGTFNGGPTSANIPIDVLGQSGISVSVQTSSNNISSAPVTSNLITQVPVVTAVAATDTQVTANVATVPTGLSATGYLMDGSTVIAGPVTAANNKFTFPYNALGKVGLSVVAHTVNGGLTGPQSEPVTLLATAPALAAAKIYTDPSNAQQWRVDLEWERLPDAAENVSSYSVSVYQGTTQLGTQTTTGTTTSLTFAKSAVTAGQTQTVQLYATGVSGGTSPTQTLSAIFTAPSLTALNTGKEQLNLTWTAPTIPAANNLPVTYQPVITAGGSVIFTGSPTKATQGAVPLSELALSSGGAILAMVNVSLGPVTLLADSGMGTGTNASPMLASTVVGLVTTDAVSKISTLNWTAIPGASAYTIDFTNGTQETGITNTTFPLKNALAPGAQLGYTITGTGTSNGAAVTGPPSSRAFVPTNPANVSEVRFDGSNVFVSWSSVASALSYNVSIYDNSTPTPVNLYSGTTSETSSYFSVNNMVAGKVYTVYVQPITDSGVGLSGTTKALFGAGFFLSQQPATAASPYVYSAQTMAALGTTAANPPAQEIVLYLPELGATAGALGTTPITSGPFKIQPSDNTGLPYKLTIAADAAVWSFNTDSIRAVLQQNYVDFLKALESPPAGSLTGALPYGISLVQSAIACSMPQTFAEQLYYNFGFSTTSTVSAGYVDLRPGMILRVSTGDYINTGVNNPPTWINGYAGASVMDFEIGSYTANSVWSVGFDSFLSALSAQGALNVSPPAASSNFVQAGLSGAVDLYFTQFVKPFHRLYIPSTISSPWGGGSNAANANFTLAAAANYTSLQATTNNPSVTPTAYFRGRTTVEVMIKVIVNGNERLVPVGTSLGNLLEQLNMRPSTSSPLFKQLRLYRSVVSAITNLQMTAASGPQSELHFGWNGLPVYGTGNGLDGMSAPLLPGDQLFTFI
jgi:hypothetical protein